MHHVGILYDQFMMHGQRNIKLYIVTLQVCLGIQDRHIHVFSLGGVDSGQQAPTIMFQHSLHSIMRYSQTYNNHCTFMYLLRDTIEPLLYCYLYQASDPNDVSMTFIFRYPFKA